MILERRPSVLRDISNLPQNGNIKLKIHSAKQKIKPYDEEYANDIRDFMIRVEGDFQPTDYMPKQSEVTFEMREVLLDWLFELSSDFGLKNSTIFLAVNCIDRYLADRQIMKKFFQLLGVTCLLIAVYNSLTIARLKK